MVDRGGSLYLVADRARAHYAVIDEMGCMRGGGCVRLKAKGREGCYVALF